MEKKDWEQRLEDFYFEREKILPDQSVGIDIDDWKEFISQELDKARKEEYKKLIEIFSNLKKEDLVNKGFILSLIKEELSKVEKYPQKAVYLSAEEVERREKLSKLTTK